MSGLFFVFLFHKYIVRLFMMITEQIKERITQRMSTIPDPYQQAVFLLNKP